MEGFELYAIYMQALGDNYCSPETRWENLTSSRRGAWDQVGRRVDPVLETKVVEESDSEAEARESAEEGSL